MKRTAMQEFIKWGDKMMKDHPMKELGFGEAIDKAVALLELERQQIVQSYNKGAMSPQRLGSDFYTETYGIDHNELYLEMVVKSEKSINLTSISDKDINKAAWEYAEVYQCPTEIKMCKHDVISAWNKAIQWYKEELKKRQ